VAHDFEIEALLFPVLQAQARQNGRDDECVAGGDAEIGNIDQAAALAAVPALQAHLVPALDPAGDVVLV
jgi:hypothetical protein